MKVVIWAATMETLSIIVPTYNEAGHIRAFLRHLRCRAPKAEIILVDGGSEDATIEEARGQCDFIVTASKGRPAQMNAGAGSASGSVFWFLHADCEISKTAVQSILQSTQGGYCGGCFRIQLPDPRPVFRLHDSWAHAVGKLIRVRCGDHGLFSTREAFHEVKGYPDVPLMEDVDFVRALHRIGRFAWLEERLKTSCRRHHQLGPYRYTFICGFIVALYCMGVGNATLARWYKRLIPARHSSKVPRPLPEIELELFADFR